jgi:hypothetical protein
MIDTLKSVPYIEITNNIEERIKGYKLKFYPKIIYS